jgi:DNA-nicking Smr family endonuclease
MNDEKIFREAMDGVRPLGNNKVLHKHRTEPTVGQRRRKHDAANEEREERDPNYLHTGDVNWVHPLEVLEWKKDGVQPEVFRKLKTGKYPVEGNLDLHRKTVKEARKLVYQFVNICLEKGWRSVVIAHGRGEKSATPARIKSYVVHWMRQVPEVIAFSSPSRHLGGTGALFVLLRKNAMKKEENRERHGFKSDQSQM